MRNLNIRKWSTLLLIACSLSIVSCKRDKQYELVPEQIAPASAGKLKLKTDEQYISILYANLFQKAISIAKLSEISDAVYSVGDKQLAHELVVSNFFNNSEIKIPKDGEMRADIDAFLAEAYKRFYVRNITEAEKTYLHNYIQNNPDVTVEFIYASLALSNEYQYY